MRIAFIFVLVSALIGWLPALPDEPGPCLEQFDASRTPRFLVMKGSKIVSNRFGTGGWELTLAAMRKAVD